MGIIVTTPTTHSPIGASSYYRWSKCAASVRLSKGIESILSKYAEEGTQAHEMAAAILIQDNIDYSNKEMQQNVKIYTDFIKNEANTDANSTLLVEHKFDLRDLHPGLFGTADAVLYLPTKKKLIVADLKYGKGIAVEVENNSQLLYYALGALTTTNFIVQTVELVIIQPRCEHENGVIRRWEFDPLDILDFAHELKKAATATEDPNAPFSPGDHCRFCPGAGICPALEKRAFDVAKQEFSPLAPHYEPTKLAQILNWLPTLESWIESVRSFAYGEAKHGRYPPGFKLVQKKAIRKWKDEATAMKFIAENTEIKRTEYLDISFKSVAQIEKLLPKALKPKISEFVESKSSGDVLVPDTDPREALKLDAASEFTVISNQTE